MSGKRVKLHMIVIEKEDGTPLATLGKMAKDPIILAGFLIALKNLSEELSEISQERLPGESTFTFHNFGKYYVLLYSREGLLASLMIDALRIEDLPKMGDLLVFLSRTYEIFIEKVWSKLSDSFKEANLIPQELFKDFEKEIVKTVISKNWYNKIALSEYFILSETGLTVLVILYSELLKRLQQALGPKLTKALLEKLSSTAEIGGLKISREKDKLRVSLYIPVEEEKNMLKALENLAQIYVEVIKRIKHIFHPNALEQLNVLSI